MDLFQKAKGMVGQAGEKIAGMADSAKDAVTTKVMIKVIDTQDLTAGYLEMTLQDLQAQNKSIDVTAVGHFCVVKLTN